MEKAIIKFKNGTQIETEINGNCYIAESKLDFPVDLSEVTVITGDTTTILREVVINEAASIDNRYYFTLRELTEQELKDIKIQADIQYLAMMTDIEL